MEDATTTIGIIAWFLVLGYASYLLVVVRGLSRAAHAKDVPAATAAAIVAVSEEERSILKAAAAEVLLTAPTPDPPHVDESRITVTMPDDLMHDARTLRTELEREIAGWDSATRAEGAAQLDLLTLARYLLAVPASKHATRVAAALEHFRTSNIWRVEYRVCARLAELHPAAAASTSTQRRRRAVRNHFYSGMGGTTKDGTPFVVERIGAADHPGLARDPQLLQTMQDAIVSNYELLFRCVRACSVAVGKLVYAVVVVDLGGIGLGLSIARNLTLVNFAAKYGSANWPEISHKVLLVNAPSVVASLFALMQPLLTEKVQNKIAIINERDTPAVLRETIDPQQLPKFLGGARPDEATAVPHARPVTAQALAEWQTGAPAPA